jgi:hypothetical protein
MPLVSFGQVFQPISAAALAQSVPVSFTKIIPPKSFGITLIPAVKYVEVF